ncbi:MAG: NCS2 family permease [Acholeplasmataceae bacterium]|nr:NCS2 family permease [Acholeplasmataceae bacterium]
MNKIKTFFQVEQRGSTITKEILAGVTIFLAMAYILPVNSFMLADAGLPVGGVFFATAISAALASILMGLLANLPVALAPGMGLNALFTYTIVNFGLGYSPQAALAAVFVSGVLFLLISLTGLRKIVINAIPRGLKLAVGAGIGFFIAFIGFKNAGIIVSSPSTFVQLGDFSHPAVLLGLFGLILVIVLFALKVRFALIISIGATAVIGLILNAVGVGFMPEYNPTGMSGLWEGTSETFLMAFKGLKELFSGWEAIPIIITLLFVDFFDTAGTLMAVGGQAGLLDDEGQIQGGDNALIVDAVGTVVGSLLGTSTVTSYIESSTGIEQGGRTGLSAIVVGILFIASIFLYPILSIFNGVEVAPGVVFSPVTAMALVLVGAIMFGQLKDIDWADQAIVISAFFTVITMLLAYSIATGIAIGFVVYVIVMLAQRRFKEVSPVMYGLAAIFLLYFVMQYAL